MAGQLHGLRLSRGRVALAVVVVLLVGLNVVLLGLRHRAGGGEHARAQVLAAARAAVPAMLSYEYDDFDSYRATALAQTTGPFRRSFERTLDADVEPAATKDRLSVEVVVTSAGVVRASRDRATVLVFLTRALTKEGEEGSTPAEGSLVLDLRSVAGHWRVSALAVGADSPAE
ncbi:MAG: hypothetical protein QM572_02420 [Nocardioides sp.]|uniref:hypothetical protein n=1 Tax=Nocardioides sp. TaxID=35761 RepID=UPI0039E511D4